MKKLIDNFLKKIFRLENKFVAALLSVLGFSSGCFFMVGYGSPYAYLKIQGKVTSKETKLPVENIEVKAYGYKSNTDVNGDYFINIDVDQYGEQFNFYMQFNDVDKEENGYFENKELKVVSSDNGFKDGDGWYIGEKTINIDTELDNKTE